MGSDLPEVYRASGDRLYAAGNAEEPQVQVMAYEETKKERMVPRFGREARK